ncbi:MAG: AAA family ATPase [Lachnospiraceae bacterium]|nr:AAA family ATPase [Lachnospiraceae bacterium]
MNTSQRFVCVSRPRRFGTTMAADMLCAYYGRDAGSRELFEKCLICRADRKEIEKPWDEHLGKFDVIRLVMTDFF